MKSDSGGEMESCRSSDSELERELHEKEREIQERDRELTNCYRTIAERDTELIKVRLECQRLLEDNRHLRDQLEHLEAHTNPKKQMEMEKEIDSLKWHLSVVSIYNRVVHFMKYVPIIFHFADGKQSQILRVGNPAIGLFLGACDFHASSDKSQSKETIWSHQGPGAQDDGEKL